VVIQRTFRQLCNSRFSPNLVTKRSSVSRRGIRKDIFENFHFRSHLPQNLKSKIGQTGTSLRAGYSYGMHCREILFTPRCSPRTREFPRSSQLFSTTYVCVYVFRFPATSDRGSGDPQTCPNFRLWQMAIPIHNATTRGVRSGPKMSENAQF